MFSCQVHLPPEQRFFAAPSELQRTSWLLILVVMQLLHTYILRSQLVMTFVGVKNLHTYGLYLLIGCTKLF